MIMQLNSVAILSMVAVFAGSTLVADDLTDLRTANEAMVRSHNELDPEALVSLRHPDSVTFLVSGNTAIDRSVSSAAEELERSKRSVASLEKLAITPLETSYRVIGSTGIAWGLHRIARKRKGGGSRAGGESVHANLCQCGWTLVACSFALLRAP